MVALWINNRAFLLGVRAPQQEDDPFAVLVNQAYHFIRKGFPPQAGMRVRWPARTVSTVFSNSTPGAPSFPDNRARGEQSREWRLPALCTYSLMTAGSDPGRTENARPCDWPGPW